MTLENLVIWLIFISCLMLLFRAISLPSGAGRGWAIVAIAISMVTGSAFYVDPDLALYLGGSLWLAFVILPLLGHRLVVQSIDRERYDTARRLASYLRWLHPADGWLEQPDILQALVLGQQGRIDEATQILDRHTATTAPFGRLAMALLCRMQANWDRLLVWIRDRLSNDLLRQDLNMAVYYLRALGETGDLDRLVQEYDRLEPALEKSDDPTRLYLARVFVFAFCGEIESVRELFDRPLSDYSPRIRQFWIATAQMAGGRADWGQGSLQQLRRSNNFTFTRAIDWRLSHPPADPATALSEGSARILSRLKTELIQEFRYGGTILPKNRKAIATYSLILANVLVFAFATLEGGNQDLDTLYRLGALVPQSVWEGEWWRLVAATFLHYGTVHVAVNMLGLYVLGRLVEFNLGIGRYLLVYAIAGCGSMFVFTVLVMTLAADSWQIVVGASGAIMGLIGAIAAILLRGWQMEKARIAAKRLQMVLLIIVVQVAFDLSVPEVCFVCHASGLVLGFLATLLLLGVPLPKWRRGKASDR